MFERRPTRSVLPVVAASLALLLGLYVGIQVYRHARHYQAANRMGVAILSLAQECPNGLTEDQWAYCVVWTWNLNCNIGQSDRVPTDDLVRIERELQLRIDKGADLATIDWIWDQYIQSYPGALSYDRYRPTSPSNREAFEAGSHGDNPLPWLRAWYKEKVGH